MEAVVVGIVVVEGWVVRIARGGCSPVAKSCGTTWCAQ
jgi:hypothetical protein